MAEINSGELVAKAAIKEVYDLRDAFISSSDALKELVKTGKDLGVNIKQAESTKQLRTETTKLTQAQVELQKIEKQIEVVNARTTKAYQDQQKALQALKKEQNDKLILGAKEAKLINEQNASVKQLEVALNKNRAAYKALADEEARSSKEGKELKAVIDQQDAAVKKLNGGLGDFRDNVGNYTGALKGLKNELKDAKDEMAFLAKNTGTTSPEFVKAAAKAGDLKDQINDLNDQIKNTAGNKFETIGNSLKDVGSRLINLDFEGAANSAKQFAAVVKSLTFAEILAGLESFGETLATIGKAILTNPLFIFAAVVAGIALAFKFFNDQQEKATARAIERYKKEEEALLSRYDKEIKLQKILGKQTFELEKDRQRVIIDTADKELELLTNRKKGIQDLLKLGLTLNEANKFADAAQKALDDDKIKRIEELKIARRDAVNEIEVITAEQAEFEKKSSADVAKQRKDDLFALNKFRLQIQIEGQEELAQNEEKSFNDRYKAAEKAVKLKNSLAKLEYQEALENEKLTDTGKLLLQEEYQNKVLQNKKAGAKEEQKINEELTKAARDNALKENQKEIDIQKKRIENEVESAQRLLDYSKKAIEDQAFARVAAGEDQVKVRKETDAKLLALEKSLTDDYISLQIDRVQKTLQIEGLSAEEKLALDKELYDLRLKLTDAFYKQLDDGSAKHEKTEDEKRIESLNKQKALVQTLQGIYNNFDQAITTIIDSNRNARLQALDDVSKATEAQMNKELALAGDDQKKKDEINERYAKKQEEIEKKKRAEARKGAQLEKALAIVSAGIQAGLAVLNALSTVKPYPLAVVAAISAGVLGAAQVAAIANKPIPAYEVGTKSAAGGLSLVGEAGTELMIKPGGQMELTPSVATLMDVPRGTEIVPHGETMRRLAMGALQQNGGSKEGSHLSGEMLNEMKQLNRNIKNIKQPKQVGLIRSGATIYKAIKESETHTRIIRDINIGKGI